VVEEPGEAVQLDVPRSEIRRGELAELLGNALKRCYAAAQLVQPATHASPPVQQRLPTMQNDARPEGFRAQRQRMPASQSAGTAAASIVCPACPTSVDSQPSEVQLSAVQHPK
jgi:hypothetical protein